MPVRPLALLIALAWSSALVGCSSDGDPRPPATGTVVDPTAGASASSTQADAGSDASESAIRAPRATPEPSTAPPNTDAPAAAPAAIESYVLDDLGSLGALDAIADVAVVSIPSPTALLVGRHADRRGQPSQAYAWRSAGEGPPIGVGLDDGGAVESWASGIVDTSTEVVIVGGAVDDGGRLRPVLWRSSDGVVFGPPEFPTELDGDGEAVAVGAVGDLPIVIVATRAPSGTDLSALRAADGWSVDPLDPAGFFPSVAGVVALGDTVLVTGSAEIDDVRRAAMWRSDDSGATFTRVDAAAIADKRSIGAPALGGDGFIATAAAVDPNVSTTIVTSPDGLAWREIPLTLFDRDGEASNVVAGGAPGVVPYGDGFAVGVSDIGAYVAIVDQAGTGIIEGAPDTESDRYGAPTPFVLGETLRVVANSEASFRIASYRPGSGERNWSVDSAPEGARDGPLAMDVTFAEAPGGVVARGVVYPVIVTRGDGRLRYQAGVYWNGRRSTGWSRLQESDLPFDITDVAAAPAVAVAVNAMADDPLDAGRGPAAGTEVRVWTGGSWSPPELLLSGPGGELLEDVAALGDGFVAVGARSDRDEQGVERSTAAIVEYADGEWSEVDLVGAEVDFEWLNRVVVSGDGVVVALGGIATSGINRPRLWTRRLDTGWAVAEPSFAQLPGADVYDLTTSGRSIELLVQVEREWFRYSSNDGVTYSEQAVTFDDPANSYPAALVDVDGVAHLIGTSVSAGVRSLAVWRLDAAGTTQTVALAQPVVSRTLSVDDAVVRDGVVLIGGQLNWNNVVWELTLAD